MIVPHSIYSRDYPNDQNAVDLFEGEWTSRLPGKDLRSGSMALFENDPRPEWIDRRVGGLKGKRVLELGPLEGAHTYKLEALGAEVLAVESNRLAFERCLISKNVLGMKSKFLLGDFVPYLARTEQRFDLVFASGVLYHMIDPVAVVRDLCRISDHVFLWTHFYDASAIAKNPRFAKMFTGVRVGLTAEGTQGACRVTLHERKYRARAWTYLVPGFCGGMDVKTHWLTLDDLTKCFETFGFKVGDCEVDLAHVHGPCVTLHAARVR